MPAKWVQEVNRAQTEAELEAVRRSVQRGQPYGAEAWAKPVALRLGLESTLRARSRPHAGLDVERRTLVRQVGGADVSTLTTVAAPKVVRLRVKVTTAVLNDAQASVPPGQAQHVDEP
jgi:hypothetical protein